VPVEVLFDRICRENGITHRLTKPRSPTTTGKIERLHQALPRELLEPHGPFETLEALQAGLDAWRAEYNGDRPHQSLAMAFPPPGSPRPRPRRWHCGFPPSWPPQTGHIPARQNAPHPSDQGRQSRHGLRPRSPLPARTQPWRQTG
jgi:Integrase core domain